MEQWRYGSTILNLDNGDEWSASRPDSFTPEESDPGVHGIGYWVCPRVGLKRKSLVRAWNRTPVLRLYASVPTEPQGVG
jgi:hypothetical protein